MNTFLQMVAHDLYQKLGNDLAHTAIVFPNKRASLFFNEYLAAESQTPLWSPAYISISELFQHLSVWKLGDPIRLVCELYKVFCEETRSSETLDDFYFWGEILISDFDDVDKNLVQADHLFSNLQDLKQLMEDTSYLDEEQEAAIQQFFQHFSLEKRTVLKERFISLWDKLGVIYHRFHDKLADEGIAYEGMMYKQVMEDLCMEQLPHERYVFVGFNVLNKVEKEFFLRLQKAGKALFYWDYDQSYMQVHRALSEQYPMHEAGEFIRRNLKEFPNQLPADCFNVMSLPKKVRYIASPTENAQARYITSGWRDSVQQAATPVQEKENAVVLCNESLLLPVLHSLPEKVKNVNITMGFPLAQTPVFSFIQALIALQTEGYQPQEGYFYYEQVLAVLKHPYLHRLSAQAEELEKWLVNNNRFYPLPSQLQRNEFLERVFTPHQGVIDICRYLMALLKEVSVLYRGEQQELDIFNQLYQEALFKSYTMITRLTSLAESGELAVRQDTFKRLLNRLLSAATIPFHGEPAIGMQVMGVLETRNLDFRNLLMLSVNEGQLPKSGSDSSFIPYNLRKAFGMTTIEHKNSVYAYYFYRLIQRAETVTLLYNTSSDGMNRGEMSRFMLQYLVESDQSIVHESLEAGQTPRQERHILVQKDKALLEQLYNRYNSEKHPKRVLSPSALNTYLDCSLKFYFRYLKGLKQQDEVSAEIDSALFGTIFHRTAELIYLDLTTAGKQVDKEAISVLLKNEVKVQDYVDKAFKDAFFHIDYTEKASYNGTQLIHAKVIASYIRQLLRHDLQYAPFFIAGMEHPVAEMWTIQTPLGPLMVQLGGIIDRLDVKDGVMRIVDYKTGGSPKIPENIEQLFTPEENRPGYIFQTFLYAAIMSRKQSMKVAPSLLYIHRAASDTYSPVIEMGPSRKPKTPITDFAPHEEEFRKRLQALLEEIYHPDIPFAQTDLRGHCEYCEFRELCGR